MTRTDWRVMPSFRYDTLCLLNTLTGDPFYVEFNTETYAHFKPLLTPEVETALANLKQIVKDDGKWIISALLCLIFSAAEGESLADMERMVDDHAAMYDGYRQSIYFKIEDWHLFMTSRDALRTIFRFLKSIHFTEYWQQTVLPEVQAKIDGIRTYLVDYDVVEKLESLIGITLPSPTITVYVLNYTRPHGIKIIGQNFITAASWPSLIALRTAIHEMLHPPYNVNADTQLREAILALQQDSFVQEKFASHNADFGYNEFIGYVEENCVRALEQVVNEAYHIDRDPRERWREEDGGMHVFAAALYHTLKTQNFTGGFRDFLLTALKTSLAPGNVKAVYDAFYGTEPETKQAT